MFRDPRSRYKLDGVRQEIYQFRRSGVTDGAISTTSLSVVSLLESGDSENLRPFLKVSIFTSDWVTMDILTTILLPYLPPLTNSLAMVLKCSNLEATYYPNLQIDGYLSNGRAKSFAPDMSPVTT